MLVFCFVVCSLFLLLLVTWLHTCGADEMNLTVQVITNDRHGSLYASQAAESYLRFPTTASPCSDWLPCEAEAVRAKTVTLGRCANAYSCGGR